MMTLVKTLALVVSLGTSAAHGMYYLPGVLPHSYEEKEPVRLHNCAFLFLHHENLIFHSTGQVVRYQADLHEDPDALQLLQAAFLRPQEFSPAAREHRRGAERRPHRELRVQDGDEADHAVRPRLRAQAERGGLGGFQEGHSG